MLKGFKYRLYPNKVQQVQIDKTLGCCRFVYNYYLAKKIEVYNSNNVCISSYDCIKDLVNLKEVDSNSLQQSLMNLDKAYGNFFKRIKKSVKITELGFPKFKSKHNNNQSYRTQFINTSIGGNLSVKNNKIKLPKLKFVKFDNHRQFNGIIKNCTISKTCTGKYFVSALVETEIVQLPKLDKQIGIDLGIKTFATCSDGLVIDNNKFLKKSEKRLAFLQQCLSRNKKGSNNRDKARLKVAKIHEKYLINEKISCIKYLQD